MSNYFIINNETEKVELHFDKSTYKALSIEDQKEIKSSCLFSRYSLAWVSRGLKGSWSYQRALKIAKKIGLDDRGEEGERLTFAEKMEVKKEKAQKRALKFSFKASKMNKESTQAYQNAKRISSYIVFGQPILIGHHSERRHRRDIEKIDNSMRKSVELDKKANYYNDRADSSYCTASQWEFKDPVYLNNRIKENESEIRRCKKYGYKADKYIEKLEFYQDCLNKIGGFKYNKENLKGMTHIKTQFGWYEIIRLNGKTVIYKKYYVSGDKFCACAVEYAKIKDAKNINEVEKNKTDAPTGEGSEAGIPINELKDKSIIQLSLVPEYKKNKVLFEAKQEVNQLSLF